VVLHDADTLDFLGAVGVARIFSITERHRWTANLAGAVETLQRFVRELPVQLVTPSAKKIGYERLQETIRFLDELSAESVGRRAL